MKKIWQIWFNSKRLHTITETTWNVFYIIILEELYGELWKCRTFNRSKQGYFSCISSLSKKKKCKCFFHLLISTISLCLILSPFLAHLAKLWWNGICMALFQNCVRWSRLPTKMVAKLKIEKRGDEILIVHCCYSISQNNLKF